MGIEHVVILMLENRSFDEYFGTFPGTNGFYSSPKSTFANAWVPSPGGWTLLWGPGVPLGLVVLAIAQMGVHLVFFLHLTTGPDNTNNVLALAFGILIVFLVIAGSLSIMANLNDSMMPPSELMNLHMQH
jgi:cytochrome o ubiquinol oxidase subunit IV